MPLNSEKVFGVRALTEAINRMPVGSTIIRSLGEFKPEYLTTTYVSVERKENALSLVHHEARGAKGQGVAINRYPAQNFNLLHLVKNDVVRADDVQNIRAFGTDNQTETVASIVNDKMELMKADIEYTREHLMLGALLGKITDANGEELHDLYQSFGLTRAVHTLDFKAKAEVGMALDKLKTAMALQRKGESVTGWTVLASPEFMQALIYHDSIKEVYLRYNQAEAYRNGNTNVQFSHMGIDFIQYDHVFSSGVRIKENEAIILPKGTKRTFREYFAPADMSSTVNSKAMPYYATREKLPHDTGWDLRVQSNPLPLILRPELVATLKIA